MEPATGSRPPQAFLMFLAGLEAGLMAALCLLAWMGVTAVLAHRSFWTSENLMASVFWGGDAIREGLAPTTFSGLALYLVLYSLLGAGFAAAIGNRLPPLPPGSCRHPVRPLVVFAVIPLDLEIRRAAGVPLAHRNPHHLGSRDLWRAARPLSRLCRALAQAGCRTAAGVAPLPYFEWAVSSAVLDSELELRVRLVPLHGLKRRESPSAPRA